MSDVITVLLDGSPVLVMAEAAHALNLKRGQEVDMETFWAIVHQHRALFAESVRQEKLGAN